ncbi:MAG: hypothetical protein K0S76_2360 [Herbinix sp.]|jgi:N-acetylglucosamine-6-phosphate deacetylase|nr:hypothetical protein [Herbinix sp.]
MIIKNAKVYSDNFTFVDKDITIEKKYINENAVWPDFSDSTDAFEDTVIDATGLYAIPGLTDLHFHGCAGYDFCDGTREALDAIAEYEAFHGVTTICPATMSLPEETLSMIMKNAASYHNQLNPVSHVSIALNKGSLLCGINMEGPFLSVKKKGAQNEAFLHLPDLEMFHRLDNLSHHMIKLVAIAPEEEGAQEFIEALKGKKVISIAHSNADYKTAEAAFKKGANHVTHLYNAMPPLHHRDPGVIGAAMDAPECKVELICDGIHIHPSVVRATFKMFGDDRVIFISDSMMATGLPDGNYALGGQAVRVSGNKAVLVNDGAIAGSVVNLMDCMRNAVLSMGIPLETAIKAAAVNPAKQIGIYDKVGSITPGKLANIVLLDKDLRIKHVIINGKEIVRKSKIVYDKASNAYFRK